MKRLRVLLVACLTASAASAGTVFDLQGRAVDPLKLPHGKPVVLIFVRTDCPISNRYAPVIQALSRKYSSEANFWLVYPGNSQSTASIHQQLTEYGYRIPALRDTRRELVERSGVKVTPEAAVFASQKL